MRKFTVNMGRGARKGKNVCHVLASRASGCLLDTQTLKNHPLGCRGISKNVNFL